MPPTRRSRTGTRKKAASKLAHVDLDQLIEEATVDAHDESEQVLGFYTMLDEHLEFPFQTSVLDVRVDVDAVELSDGDRIVAACSRGVVRQNIDLLDLPLPKPTPRGAEWIEAYRRWARHRYSCTGASRTPMVGAITDEEIPPEYRGWWRITETSQWVDDGLDILGPALISIGCGDDRLRMHCLLAYVSSSATKTGVSFTWMGAWEYDQMSGTGRVKLGKDGRLKGYVKIKNGDDSTFVAERTSEPDEPIEDPPSYRDKWRR